MTTNFYLNKNGFIVAEINHSDVIKQKRFGLGIQVDEIYWDAKKKKVRNDKRINYAQSVNDALHRFKGVVTNYYTDCNAKDRDVNKKDLTDYINEHFFGKNKRVKNDFMKYLDKYIEWKQNHVPKFSENTIRTFITLRGNLNAYLIYNKVAKLDFTMMDDAFFENLLNFYLERESGARKKKKNTFNKWVTNIKTVLNQAVKDGHINRINVKNFKSESVVPDKVYLTEEELDMLWNAEFKPVEGFSKEMLSLVRDAYLMYSYLSIRYGDGQRLEKGKHIIYSQGRYYLNMMPEKTVRHNKKAGILIKEKVVNLMIKYNWRMPIIDNPTFNLVIKECCKQAGMTYNYTYTDNVSLENVEKVVPKYKLITVHTSRATFITLCLLNGVSKDAICKMVGINEKTLEHYDKTTALDYARQLIDNPFLK